MTSASTYMSLLDGGVVMTDTPQLLSSVITWKALKLGRRSCASI